MVFLKIYIEMRVSRLITKSMEVHNFFKMYSIWKINVIYYSYYKENLDIILRFIKSKLDRQTIWFSKSHFNDKELKISLPSQFFKWS
jgi:hypothetical protein